MRGGFAGGVAAGTLLRRLDIMLMVTGLRCRAAGQDFTPDYGRFVRRHTGLLNDANAGLRLRYARIFGEAGADLALERMNTRIANSYGRGHPWLDCSQLAMVTRNLTSVEGRETLEEAADQLLGDIAPVQLALAQR